MLKHWISILNLTLFSSTRPVALLAVDLSPFHSFFVALVSLGPRVAVLVVDLSPSQSLLLCLAQHIESLCSLLTCLDCLNFSCFVLNTSTHSARCSVVSGGYLNTLTFVEPVLVSFYPLWRSNFLLLMFHSPELLNIFRPFSHRFQFGFCLSGFCTFVIAFPSTQPSHAVAKRACTVYK